MAKKKKSSFLSNLIWWVLILGFVVVGAILFISLLPSTGISINYSTEFLGKTFAYSISIIGFPALFGGEVTNFAFTRNGETLNLTDLPVGSDYAFNAWVFVGILLVLVGTIVALLFFKKKTVSLICALLIIVGAVFLCTDGFMFPIVNSETLGDLREIEGVSFLDLPSLMFGIFSGVAGLITLGHALTIKK